MAVEYSIDYRDSTIEVRVRGTLDRASSAKLWKDIADACANNHCNSILGLSHLDQPLKLGDAFDHQAIFLEAGITIDHRIAWVQSNPDAYKMSELVETVLLNRGLVNGRLFTDEFEARHWLAGSRSS